MDVDVKREVFLAAVALRDGLLDPDRFVEAAAAWAPAAGPGLVDQLVRVGGVPPGAVEHIRVMAATTRDMPATPGLPGQTDPMGAEPTDPQPGDPTTSDPGVPTQPYPGGSTEPIEGVPDGERLTLAWAEETQVHESGGRGPAAGEPGPATLARYRREAFHKSGGMGQVWLARDLHLGRDVALKVLRPERRTGDAYRRFVGEAKVTGRLEHPGIVPVYDLNDGGDPDRTFYTMRFVGGQTLADAIRDWHKARAGGRSDQSRTGWFTLVSAVAAVADAVAYAHAKGVLHRDLKPLNVVLGDFGEVVVLDWGMAKDRGQAGDDPAGSNPGGSPGLGGSDATSDGKAYGTPAYMAPEQAAGRNQAVDERSDVYGIGAVLYEVLTGLPPFQGKDGKALLPRVAAGDFAPPRAAAAGVPPALEAVCLRAMALEPADRYPTVRALGDDLRRWLADEPVAAYPEPRLARLARWVRRHRTAAAAAAAVVLTTTAALAATTAVVVRKNGEIDRERNAAVHSRDEARESLRLAREAVHGMLGRLASDGLVNVPQLGPVRAQVAGDALVFVHRLAEHPAALPGDELAVVRMETLVGQLHLLAGDAEKSRLVLAGALERAEALSRDRPDPGEYRTAQVAAAILAGNALNRLGRLDEAEARYRRALDVAVGLAADGPERFGPVEARARVNLAGHYLQTGRFDEAEALHGSAAARLRGLTARPTFEATTTLARALLGRGLALVELGRAGDARAPLDDSVTVLRTLRKVAGPGNDVDFLLAAALQARGRAALAAPSPGPDARPDLDAAVELIEPLTRQYREVAVYGLELAVTRAWRSAARAAAGDRAAADADLDAARATLTARPAPAGLRPGQVRDYARAVAARAAVAARVPDAGDPAALLREAAETVRPLAESDPPNPLDVRLHRAYRAGPPRAE